MSFMNDSIAHFASIEGEASAYARNGTILVKTRGGGQAMTGYGVAANWQNLGASCSVKPKAIKYEPEPKHKSTYNSKHKPVQRSRCIAPPKKNDDTVHLTYINGEATAYDRNGNVFVQTGSGGRATVGYGHAPAVRKLIAGGTFNLTATKHEPEPKHRLKYRDYKGDLDYDSYDSDHDSDY